MGDEGCVGYHNNNDDSDALAVDDQILSIQLRLGQVQHWPLKQKESQHSRVQ